MRACQLGTEGVLAHRGVDTGDLVRDHCAAVADTVGEGPAVDVAARNGWGCRVDVVGEVCGVVGVGAEFGDHVSIGAQQGIDLFLECTAGVVAIAMRIRTPLVGRDT